MCLFLCLCNKAEVHCLTSDSPKALPPYATHSRELFHIISAFPGFSWKLSLGPPWHWEHLRAATLPLSRKKNFGISYLGRDRLGQETYLSLLSDWDLSTAFATASKPYLQLRVDIRPTEDSEYLAEPWGPCSGTHPFPHGITPPLTVHSLTVGLRGKRCLRSTSWLGHWAPISSPVK